MPAAVTSLTSCTLAVLHTSEAVGAVKLGTPGHATVPFIPCPPIVGGVLSTTVIVCDTVLLALPQASTALHVIVSLYEPAHVPCVVTSLTTTTDELLHTSDDVGAAKTGVAGQNIVALTPGVPITGGALLTTVIVCATVALWLPQASTARQVIVRVNPPPQVEFVTISLTTITDELLQASLAVGGVKVGTAGHATVPFIPCPPITGGVLSITVIVWDTVLLALPQPSTALQVMVSL